MAKRLLQQLKSNTFIETEDDFAINFDKNSKTAKIVRMENDFSIFSPIWQRGRSEFFLRVANGSYTPRSNIYVMHVQRFDF